MDLVLFPHTDFVLFSYEEAQQSVTSPMGSCSGIRSPTYDHCVENKEKPNGTANLFLEKTEKSKEMVIIWVATVWGFFCHTDLGGPSQAFNTNPSKMR